MSAAVSVSSRVKWRAAKPQRARSAESLNVEALVGQQTRGQIDGNVKFVAAFVDLRRSCDSPLEHEVGQLTDTIVLLGGGNEFRCGDRTLFGMSPAGERLGADNSARDEIELGLVGDPYLALVDRGVELA